MKRICAFDATMFTMDLSSGLGGFTPRFSLYILREAKIKRAVELGFAKLYATDS
jgi:hypothetical protein